MQGIESLVWIVRQEVGDWLRGLAEKVSPDHTYRMPGLNMVMVKGVGVQVIRVPLGPKAPGCPLFYRGEDYDKAWNSEGDYYENIDQVR